MWKDIRPLLMLRLILVIHVVWDALRIDEVRDSTEQLSVSDSPEFLKTIKQAKFEEKLQVNSPGRAQSECRASRGREHQIG
ncbi:hypothetical protein QL285_085659 [Trifolium repens]|nr:hypothetical protein QL285_085659 [Trifolium repens]